MDVGPLSHYPIVFVDGVFFSQRPLVLLHNGSCCCLLVEWMMHAGAWVPPPYPGLNVVPFFPILHSSACSNDTIYDYRLGGDVSRTPIGVNEHLPGDSPCLLLRSPDHPWVLCSYPDSFSVG